MACPESSTPKEERTWRPDWIGERCWNIGRAAHDRSLRIPTHRILGGSDLQLSRAMVAGRSRGGRISELSKEGLFVGARAPKGDRVFLWRTKAVRLWDSSQRVELHPRTWNAPWEEWLLEEKLPLLMRL